MPRAGVLGCVPGTRSPVVVGRRAELATVRRLVDALAAGTGGALLVTGEPGVGKSRLVAELTARAAAVGATVLAGRAVPRGGTYRALAEALAPALREHPGALHALGAPASPTSAPPVVDPAVLLGEEVLALVTDEPGGCVLVLEDLHWADGDTLAAASYLAGAVAGAAVLLVLTARDAGPPSLATHPQVTSLPLARLAPPDVAALAAACRGGRPLPDPELAALVERSEGLPYLVEELLDAGLSALPPTLAGLVADRLAALPPTAREVLTVAAVVGEPGHRLLGAITGVGERAVLDALRAGAGAGLLTVDDRRLRWRHALTRDAVLATLLPPERAALAAAAAQVLLDRAEQGDRAAAASLLLDAGDGRRAAEVLVALARVDATRGALHGASELLDRAAAADPDAVAVVVERVRALTLLGRVDDALEVGRAALDAAAVTGDDHAELCLRMARAAVVGGRWATARSYVERAGRPGDPRSATLAADAAFGSGDVAGAAAHAAVAVRAAERLGPPETLCEALMVTARTGVRTDHGLDVAAAAFARAAQVAGEHGLTPWRVEALFGMGTVEYTAGDATVATLCRVRELAEQAGMPAHAAQIDVLRADAALLTEGPRAALPVVLGAARRAGRLQLPGLQAMCELTGAAAAALDGADATAAELVAAAASRPDAPAEIVLVPLVRGLGQLLAHDLAAATALVDEGVTALLPHGSAAPTAWFGLWALLRTATGDRDAAARQTLREHHTICALPNRAALAYADAIAAGRAGEHDRATATFTAADAMLGRLPWWNRLLRLLALEAAVTDGWGDPVPALRADLAAHEHAGAAAFARTCRDLLRTAGAPTRRGRGATPVPPELRRHGVTSREADVLALVAAGLSNAQIAQRLFLSRRTVETHVAHLLAKTGSTGRSDLGAWAARLTP